MILSCSDPKNILENSLLHFGLICRGCMVSPIEDMFIPLASVWRCSGKRFSDFPPRTRSLPSRQHSRSRLRWDNTAIHSWLWDPSQDHSLWSLAPRNQYQMFVFLGKWWTFSCCIWKRANTTFAAACRGEEPFEQKLRQKMEKQSRGNVAWAMINTQELPFS